jgi:REP element-mobilizing transposase RayT
MERLERLITLTIGLKAKSKIATMPQSLSQVYVHIIFSTKHRVKTIDDTIKEPLFEYIGGICKKCECNPIIVGGYKNHIHILCVLSRKITQMKLLEEVKKGSSKWIKTKGKKYSNFYWQNGYGIFSVNPKKFDVVKKYIEKQEEHHSKIDFQDEYRVYLKNYEVEYDEKYVWD